MKLPPELRKMIYNYYFEGIELPKTISIEYSTDPSLRKELSNTKVLKPYFGLIHHSAGVRAENVRKIYRACFTGKWLVCNINKHTADGLERTIGMCSCIRSVDKRIEFGLRFVVRDYDEEVFLQLVGSFKGLQPRGNRYLEPEFVRPGGRHWGERAPDLISDTAGICYTYHMRGFGRNEELWMFGELARLDWSKYSFEFPAVGAGSGGEESGESDEERGNTFDSEDGVSEPDCDEEDGEDEQEDQQDQDEGMFTVEDEAVYLV
jgi:hypothetical protein